MRERFDSLIADGTIFGWRTFNEDFDRSLRIECDLTPDRTRACQFAITSAELHYHRDADLWLDTVTREIVRNASRLHDEHPELFPIDLRVAIRRSMQERMEQIDRLTYETLTLGRTFAADDGKAEAKAEALFQRFAGAAPMALLKSGKPIALTGSAGGRYNLFARRAYCVERQPDGARMCAVVPGVPLYDHLLGIKLTIEADEPRFLKTANVAGGGPVNFGQVLARAETAFGTEVPSVDYVPIRRQN